MHPLQSFVILIFTILRIVVCNPIKGTVIPIDGIRRSAFCLYLDKGTDQLRNKNICDKHLNLAIYIEAYNCLSSFKPLAISCGWTAGFRKLKRNVFSWHTFIYYTRNDPNFLDRSVWANNADPEEQSHQGLHCLPFLLRLFDRILSGLSTFCLNFKLITARFSGVQKFMNLTVCLELSMDYSNNHR